MSFFLHRNTAYHFQFWPVDWKRAYSLKEREGRLLELTGCIYITQTRKHNLIKSDCKLMLDVNCKTKPKISRFYKFMDSFFIIFFV